MKLKQSAGVAAIAAAVVAIGTAPNVLASLDRQSPSAAAAPNERRVSAKTVGNGQAKPKETSVQVLATGRGSGGQNVTMVGYTNFESGADCWGWSDSGPGKASLCFGPQGGPDGKSIYLQHVVEGGGVPAAVTSQFVYGSGPRGTETFRFQMDKAVVVEASAMTTTAKEGRDLPYFVQTFETQDIITIQALNAAGKIIATATTEPATVPEGAPTS